MRLYKRPNSPYWWATFSVNGKVVKKSTKRPLTDEKNARKVMLTLYQQAHDETQFGIKTKVTLEEAFDLHIGKQENESTRTSYTLTKRKVLGLDQWNKRKGHATILGSTLCDAICDEDIERLAKCRKKAGLTNNSVNIELRNLRAVVYGLPKRYAANRDLEWPMLQGKEKTRFLSDEEVQGVIGYLEERLPGPSYRKALDLFIFILDTGARLSEALGADWQSINMKSYSIERYNQKTGNVSLAPISDRLHAILKRLHNQSRPFDAMSRAIKVLRRAITEATKEAVETNLRRGTPTIHTIRDTFASGLAADNMSLLKISKLLGHSSPTMTRKYAHIVPEEAADEARMRLNARR
jgi:integrase